DKPRETRRRLAGGMILNPSRSQRTNAHVATSGFSESGMKRVGGRRSHRGLCALLLGHLFLIGAHGLPAQDGLNSQVQAGLEPRNVATVPDRPTLPDAPGPVASQSFSLEEQPLPAAAGNSVTRSGMYTGSV